MNDTMSLLLATGILAVGGLGLIMYKTGSDEKNYSENDSENLFDLRSYFGNSDEEEKDDNAEEKDEESEVYEQPKRSRGSKTKSSRKNTGTKRRY
jgi:hypothetical protein